MQPGLSEVAGDVEADPGAVFEAHGAESVDELVAEESDGERDAASDRAVSRLFDGDLSRPERRPASRRDRDRGEAREAPEPVTTPAVLAELERVIEESEDADADGVADVELEALDDAEVATALAAAEELEAEGSSASVPPEWREE